MRPKDEKALVVSLMVVVLESFLQRTEGKNRCYKWPCIFGIELAVPILTGEAPCDSEATLAPYHKAPSGVRRARAP